MIETDLGEMLNQFIVEEATTSTGKTLNFKNLSEGLPMAISFVIAS